MTSYLFVRRDRSNPSPQLLSERKCLFIKSCSTWRWMRRAAHLGSSLSVVSSQLKFLSYSRQVRKIYDGMGEFRDLECYNDIKVFIGPKNRSNKIELAKNFII